MIGTIGEGLYELGVDEGADVVFVSLEEAGLVFGACSSDALAGGPAEVAPLAAPDYLVSLRPLLPSLRVLVTGGIAPAAESIAPWLAAGAVAVGIGGALGTAATVGRTEVARRCREALHAAGSP